MSKPDIGILTIDIETSPIEAFCWGLWDQNIGIDFVKVDWTIFSYAAKFLGEKKIYYGDTSGRGKKKVRDDKALTGEIRDLLDEADIVIAQNGKRFDIRKINARLIQHGYAPPQPFRVIDTMLVAKKYFAFTSQKLKWTSEALGATPKDDHRRFPGFELWKECLKDNPKAWAEMKKYNIQDVRSTEEVYLKLRPWIDQHPNIGAYKGSEQSLCPKCGSDKLQAQGFKVLQQGRYQRYQCQECAGWSRGKEMLIPLNVRRKMLAPI